MGVFAHIAYKEGLLFDKWGPCSCAVPDYALCIQCEHADKLEAEGKDWTVEFDKAMKARKDSDHE